MRSAVDLATYPNATVADRLAGLTRLLTLLVSRDIIGVVQSVEGLSASGGISLVVMPPIGFSVIQSWYVTTLIRLQVRAGKEAGIAPIRLRRGGERGRTDVC
jgi:hypothetical protein